MLNGLNLSKNVSTVVVVAPASARGQHWGVVTPVSQAASKSEGVGATNIMTLLPRDEFVQQWQQGSGNEGGRACDGGSDWHDDDRH